MQLQSFFQFSKIYKKQIKIFEKVMWSFNNYHTYFNFYPQYNQLQSPNFITNFQIFKKSEDQLIPSQDSMGASLNFNGLTKNSPIKMEEDIKKPDFLINGLVSEQDAENLCQNKIKKIWSDEQTTKLIELVEKYEFDWDLIAKQFNSKTSSQCQNKYRKFNSLAGRQKWTQEDDQLIKKCYQTYGSNWIKFVPYFKNKTSRQIRQRYLNYLRPNLTLKQWTFQQDLLLSKLVQENGKKWKSLQKYFPGRSQNILKNRFYGHIERILKLKQKQLKQNSKHKKPYKVQ